MIDGKSRWSDSFIVLTSLVTYESISPTNLHNTQRCQKKVNGKSCCSISLKFLLKFNTYFQLQLLCEVSYFGTFLPNVVAIKSIRNYLHKNSSTLGPKILVKLSPENINGLAYCSTGSRAKRRSFETYFHTIGFFRE
jgi:hypothetical protein